MGCRSRFGTVSAAVGIAAASFLAAGCDRAQIVRRDAGAELDASVRRGARVPARPDVPGGGGEERIYVLRDPLLSQQPDRWRSLGWDLDGRCTETPAVTLDAGVLDGGALDGGALDGGVLDGGVLDGGVLDGGVLDGGVLDGGAWAGWDLECSPRRAASAGPVTDGDDCRDNAFGAYVTLALAALPTDVQAEATMRMARGEFALLVRLRGYDGAADDALVEVDVWPTVYGAPAGGMRGELLRWDGTDELWIAREGFSSLDDDTAVIRDAQGYVAGGMLVMRLPTRADFDFASADVLLRMRVTDATITARIDPDPAARLEDVTISGRWPLADLFAALPWLGLCPGDPADDAIARLVRDGLEPAADVASEPLTGSAPLVPCEAISVAVGMTGYPARRGGVTSTERPPGVCPTAM